MNSASRDLTRLALARILVFMLLEAFKDFGSMGLLITEINHLYARDTLCQHSRVAAKSAEVEIGIT